MISWIRIKYDAIEAEYPTHTKIGRYIVSGGTATLTNLFLLYLFTSVFGIWYIVSAMMSFVIAFGVSFSLQKYWTFKDSSTEKTHRQMVLYFIVAVINLSINTGLLYLVVQFIGLQYLVGQIATSACVALESYFVYQFLIFKKSPSESDTLS